jgi:type IV pilus assembly protein PilV
MARLATSGRLPGRRRVAGVTLVEVLVALVVLSIGLLGIAALYVESLQSGRTAVLRSQAVALAADLADRIRANRDGGPTYDDGTSGAGTRSATCVQGGGGCAPDVMAAHDKAEWTALVTTLLPAGNATVVVNAGTTPTTYTITINWTEPTLGPQQYVLSFQT